MKKIIFCVVLFLFATRVSSQKVVMRHSNGIAIPYTSGVNAYVEAYNAALPGDTIYVPGGYFNAVNFNKPKLTILGAGHYPDSTSATSETILTGGFTLFSQADSLFFSGFVVNGNIDFEYNQSIDYVTITRNRITGTININGDGSRTNACEHVLIKENVVNKIFATNALNCIVANNIIHTSAENFVNSSITNNIFLNYQYYEWPHYFNSNFYEISNCLIQNNICNRDIGGFANCNNNTISNNLFTNTPPYGTNTASGNYHNVSQPTIFINQSGYTFDYTHDYHLQNPGTYLGTDGTQVGIYGGLFGPYKPGAVPKNPHIISKTISPTTDSNGNLNINIKVGAQDY